MIRYILIGLAVMGIGLGGWAVWRDQQAAKAFENVPVIHVKDSLVDLGTISLKDGPFRVSYEVSNWGQSTLKIESSKSSCGCFQPRFSKTEIAPGESGVVELDISPNSSGFQEVSLTLGTNDPVQSQFTLHAKWTGVEAIEFEPLVLDFGTIDQNHTPALEIRYRKLIEEIEVAQVTADPPELLAKIEGDHIVVSCRPTKGPGRHQGVVRIELKPPGQRPVQIPVHWLVEAADYTVEPASLFFGAVEPGEQRTLSIRVVDPAGNFVRPEKISWKSPLEGAEFSIEADQVTVNWKMPQKLGLNSGQLAIDIDGNSLLVPVSGLIQGVRESRKEPSP